ncbi:MAG: hypothetical protein H6709_19970 [Kofleriaceae bacterium]|nr:hypothetical protein [Kofleriaceae bacterium]MCB9574364.1 hypothetical protein [Kofleriaceae bacterium]
MAAALILTLAVTAGAATGCSPEVGSGTYHCGPDRSCPDDLRCDEVSTLCVFPELVESFDCGENGNVHEDDDAPARAFDVGVAGCGQATVQQSGCIDNAGDVDYLRLTTPVGCDGTLSVTARAPVAFMPVTVEIVADDGTTVLGDGTVCEDLDDQGREWTCATAPVTGATGYLVRVRGAGVGQDCDGACAYNRYTLAID